MNVSDIDWTSLRRRRAGIVPMMRLSETALYAFSLDNGSATLGDFGGGFNAYLDTDLLDTALREYKEECWSVFGEFDRNSLANCRVLITPLTILILIEIDSGFTPSIILERFALELQKHKPIRSQEVQGIVWLTKKQLEHCRRCRDDYHDNPYIYRMHPAVASAIDEHYEELGS